MTRGKAGWVEKLGVFYSSSLDSDMQRFTLSFEILQLKLWEERNLLPHCKAGVVWDTLLGVHGDRHPVTDVETSSGV